MSHTLWAFAFFESLKDGKTDISVFKISFFRNYKWGWTLSYANLIIGVYFSVSVYAFCPFFNQNDKPFLIDLPTFFINRGKSLFYMYSKYFTWFVTYFTFICKFFCYMEVEHFIAMILTNFFSLYVSGLSRSSSLQEYVNFLYFILSLMVYFCLKLGSTNYLFHYNE